MTVISLLALFVVSMFAMAATLTSVVSAHGSVLDPVARQSRWRYDRTAPTNYDDNGMFCGGFYIQFGERNRGRCGLCGDNWAQATPRPHELGGRYGEGVIVRSYRSGDLLPVSVAITANHKGHFHFQLCNLDENDGIEDAECFAQNRLYLESGAARYRLPSSRAGRYSVALQIPDGLRCEHCVLQWTYVAANNWGMCRNGLGRVGCGPQEHFRACSDIEIY